LHAYTLFLFLTTKKFFPWPENIAKSLLAYNFAKRNTKDFNLLLTYKVKRKARQEIIPSHPRDRAS